MGVFLEDWEKIHSEQEWGRYPSEIVIRFVARNFYQAQRNQIKILDFGCGGGANTWYLAREGFDVYAFDGAPSAIKNAEAYLQREGYCAVNFDVMDGIAITYEDNFFDCVIDNVCIYANTFENIVKMYEQTYRVLKNGGKLFSSCFGTRTAGYGIGVCLEKGTYKDIEDGMLSGRATAHFYEVEEFENVLKKTGFRNVHVDTMTYTDNGVLIEMFIAKAEK